MSNANGNVTASNTTAGGVGAAIVKAEDQLVATAAAAAATSVATTTASVAAHTNISTTTTTAPLATATTTATATATTTGGMTLSKSASSASLPMFVPSSMAQDGEGDEGNNLDLDDLFRDCYFGDFAVPVTGAEMVAGGSLPIATHAAPTNIATPITSATANTNINATNIPTTTTAPPPPPPPVIAPLVPNDTFYSAPTPAAATTTTITTSAAAVPVAIPSSAVTTAKRKAEEALDQATGSLTPASKKTNGTSTLSSSTNANAASSTTKELTDQQKVERRERNRKHAKRSRLRKKFLLESLQEQINGLQSEIESLKEIIQKECPDKADSLLSSIYNSGGSGTGPQGSASGSFTPLPMPSGFGPVKALMEPDFRLMSALSGSQQNFAISDPSLPDNPIVYVSQGFLELTGYTLDQVLGRNCRFLQGPGTDQSAVDIIRKGVREGVDTSVCLLNYKADGTPFWNQFFVAALRDAENNVVNFVGVQCEVSKAVVEKQMKQKEAEAEKAQKEG